MAAPLDTSLVCPVLIGRALHVEALERLIGQAAAGRGRAALLAGEAGLGKSRLVSEVRTHAARLDFNVLIGRCFELDQALPYAPLLDLLRVYLGVRAPDVLAEALGPMAPHLIELLPEFAALAPARAASAAGGPEHERHRIVQAFVQFFARQAAVRPLLAIVEDIHWSDESSLEILLTIARRTAEQPLLLLLTYRADEAPTHLVAMLAALERERLADEIRLAPLAETETDQMLRAIFAQRQPIRGDFLSALYMLTEGNPFFVEEVLKSLVAAGDIFYTRGQWERKPLGELNIPRTVQVAVSRRVERLSPTARQLLTLAAIAGRRFDFELMERLTKHDERTLLALIKELIAAQLVVEETAETFAFRHALTREALYTGLLARERKALHGQVAHVLEALVYERSADAHEAWAADLAGHFYAAGMWPQALTYARKAAEYARRLYAPRVAIAHLTRGLDAARRLNLAPPFELYRARGQMHETLGEFEAARDDYTSALEAARVAGTRMARPSTWRVRWATRSRSDTASTVPATGICLSSSRARHCVTIARRWPCLRRPAIGPAWRRHMICWV
jgi:predicted ATPase